ncbi:hypothetical protein REPUB_Repub13aG0135200 [Reevesia pubescens]
MEGDQFQGNHPPSLVAQGTKKHSITFSQFQGFWCPSEYFPNIISFQKHFQALDDDIIIASKPKAGTTWLKALVFSIVNRNRYTLSNTPLNSANPHDLVPFFELTLYVEKDRLPDLTSIPSPRLFSTHLPYSAIPESIKQAKTRILYLTRNPLDVIVSYWHFVRSVEEYADWPLEECLEMFSRGEDSFGPFWDHVSGYWKLSLEQPNKILFLRYEDLKKHPILNIKRIAEFVGFPFSVEEETAGVIEEMAKLCSLSNLKDLEQKMNKIEGKFRGIFPFEYRNFFRKGEVGDNFNYLTPSAIDRFSKILLEKLSGSGLEFKLTS